MLPLVAVGALQRRYTVKGWGNLTGQRGASAIVSEELPKVARLAAQGLADTYLLFTNHSLPAGAAAKLEEEIRQEGAKQARVFGAEWINQAIVTNPTLRRLVPRLYGPRNLPQIITNQDYQQARSVLDSLSEELACFVPTEAYKKCSHVRPQLFPT